MKTRASLKNRQGGAVAVMVGIGMVMLVGFLALVIDLGHLYIAKTELQNAADAAALAGAKELNGKASGITGVNGAVNKAIAIAAQNRYDFSKPVDITIANISVGNCPDPDKDLPALPDCIWVAAAGITDAVAANKYFIKVDTGPRQLNAWFAPIFNLVTGGNYSITSTFGMAVAGRYLIDITPLAMCAVDVSKCPPPVGTCTTTTPPCECGYERGKTYKVSDINPIGPGTLYWLDPLATTSSCTITSADDMRPFVCQGKAAINTSGNVYTNTGVSSGPLLGALDSRFNDYPSQAQCDPATAPPDENVKEYRWQDSYVSAWMNPVQTQQAASVISRSETLIETDSQGVVWSFVRPEGNPIGVGPVGNPTGTRTWNSSSYPSSPSTPYTDSTNPNLYTAQAGGKPERRVMNLVIVKCESAGGVCREVPVAGIGKFLLQKRANDPSDKEVYVEFGEFVPGGPNVTEYKLYR